MKTNSAISNRRREHAERQRIAYVRAIAASRLTEEQRACVRKLIAMHPHLSDNNIAKIAAVDAAAVTHARHS